MLMNKVAKSLFLNIKEEAMSNVGWTLSLKILRFILVISETTTNGNNIHHRFDIKHRVAFRIWLSKDL